MNMHRKVLSTNTIRNEKGALLDAKVKKFLNKGFRRGLPFSNVQLNSVISALNRNPKKFDIDDIDKDYKAFLNKYGCLTELYLGGFCVYGSSRYQVNNEQKIDFMKKVQKRFEKFCRKHRMKESRIKNCWLIARKGSKEEDQYYINLSGKNKRNVYSVSSSGTTRIFAKGFLDFLDKFYHVYEIYPEERGYLEEMFD